MIEFDVWYVIKREDWRDVIVRNMAITTLHPLTQIVPIITLSFVKISRVIFVQTRRLDWDISNPILLTTFHYKWNLFTLETSSIMPSPILHIFTLLKDSYTNRFWNYCTIYLHTDLNQLLFLTGNSFGIYLLQINNVVFIVINLHAYFLKLNINYVVIGEIGTCAGNEAWKVNAQSLIWVLEFVNSD